jgi:hypothetical protein
MITKGRIVNSGVGGFLNPPGHPEHTHSVETDLRRKPENRGSMSLSYAVKSQWLDSGTFAEAMTLLLAWAVNKLPLTAPAVKDWILQCLGYFRGCYNFRFGGTPADNEAGWEAGNLTIDQGLDPMKNADFHAGVHHIREFYPDYTPRAVDFQRAYWGKQRQSAF